MKKLTLFLITILLIPAVTAWGSDPSILTMEDCIEIGLKKNFDLQKNEYDFLTAKEGTEQLLSQYEPTLNFSTGIKDTKYPTTTSLYGSRNRTETSSVGINKKSSLTGGVLGLTWTDIKTDTDASSATYSPSYDSSVTLSYSQPLLNNFAGINDRRSIKIIKLRQDAADLTQVRNKEVITNKIKKAYLDLNFAKLNLEIEKHSLARAQRLLRINKKKFADGLIEEVDIIASEASINIKEASIMLAEDKVKNAKDNLLNIIGVETTDYSFTLVELNKPLSGISSEEDIIKKAIANRAELRLIKDLLEIDSANIAIKENSKLPILTLDTSYKLAGTEASIPESHETTLDRTFPSWYVGLNLTIFPFNKKGASQVREAEYGYNKNMAEYNRLKLQIKTDAKSITRYIKTQLSYIEATSKALKLQKKKLLLEERKFAQGRSSINWIISYEDDLSQAEINNIKALTDYYKAQADLQIVIGKAE